METIRVDKMSRVCTPVSSCEKSKQKTSVSWAESLSEAQRVGGQRLSSKLMSLEIGICGDQQ